MSKVTMTGNSMESCLLDLPYEVVFEIFRRLPKGKLVEISKLSVKFSDIAGDTRFWKDVCIKYKSYERLENEIFAFEELYSESWPVKVIDLSDTKIKSPVSLKTHQLVKVTELNLSSVEADKVTIEAILAKYQCTKLLLTFEWIDCHGHVMGIAPAAFSKQTALEVLSLKTRLYIIRNFWLNRKAEPMPLPNVQNWLAQVLSYCKNLKSLELSPMDLTYCGMIDFVKILPTSLEKLWLSAPDLCPKKLYFELLAKSCPKLRELELCPLGVKFSSSLEFQFLETLRIHPCHCENIGGFVGDLYMYVLKFPALKAVDFYKSTSGDFQQRDIEMLRSMLEPHGVIVELDLTLRRLPCPVDDNLWEVSKID